MAATDIDAVKKWASDSKLSEDTAAALLNLGFSSMEALSCLASEDLAKAKLPIGQLKLVLKCVNTTFGSTGEVTGTATVQPADQPAQPQREVNGTAESGAMAAPRQSTSGVDSDSDRAFVSEVLSQLRRGQSASVLGAQTEAHINQPSSAIEAQQDFTVV